MIEKPPHNPGKYNSTVSVRNKYETALEKAIINNGFSIVNGERILWLDGELPIEAKRDDYKRLDLLGLDASGRYVLCELKFSGDGEGNKGPADADGQLLDYEKLVRSYGKWFRIHRGLPQGDRFVLSDFLTGVFRLMVVADDGYWNLWKEKNAHRSVGRKRELCRDIEHYSIAVTIEDFAKQKESTAENGWYIPSLHRKSWDWHKINCGDY